MKDLILLKEKNLFTKNGVLLGEVLQKEDGLFDFWPNLKGGYWPAYLLRQIADLLDHLNAPYQKELDEYFDKTKNFNLEKNKSKQECWLCNHANESPQTNPCNCNEKCYCKVEGMCKNDSKD